MNYIPTIGLEVHAELSTKTKIYCGCENRFGAEVNTQVCPVCSGMPGTLPVLNRKVVEYCCKMGLAIGARINQLSKQDRKNYYYPDLPKAYQISQFDIPLCEGGSVPILVNGEEKRIGVTRIHIEEDAGKLLHDDKFSGSLVDYNRCGVPLIEIVSEPDMHSSEEAKEYLEAIKRLLQYLDISDCRMQEGSIRCDVNVSLSPEGSDTLGTRAEMKNVNSFSGAVRAIEDEIKRQTELLERGETVVQETRRWDDMAGQSFSMRSKEDAQDYRYFPEPDLAVIEVSDEEIARIRDTLPELPHDRFMRYRALGELTDYECGMLVGNLTMAEFFDRCVALGGAKPKAVCNWLLGDISRILNERGSTLSDAALTPENLCAMIALIEKGTISNTAAKTVLEVIFDEDKSPEAVVEEKGLAQNNDEGAMRALVCEILDANEKSVADYKGGKTNALGFLVGQCMRASKGKGNPQIISKLLTEELAKR